MCSERSASPAPRGAGRRRLAPGGHVLLAALAALTALAAAGGLAACGKKGDPAPPLRFVPQTTDALTVAQRHLELVLELPYPKTTAAGMALPGLDRIEVWEARRPVPPAGPGAGAAQGETAAVAEAGAAGDEAGDATEAAEPAPSDEADGADELDGEPPPPTAPPAAPASPTPPPPLDPRQFVALAELRTELAGAALSAAVIGERIVIPLPLGADFPTIPEARYLAVRTVAAGEDRSEFSNQAVIVPRPPPAAPRGLAAEAGPGGVRLVWQGDGPAVIGYDVFRRGAQERTFLDPLARVDAAATEYFDDTARFGERYIYGVTAVAAREPTIASAVGSTVEVDYRDRFPPAAPAGLVALVEEGRVRLVWEAAEAADLAGYRVSRAAGGEGFTPVGDLVTAAEWVDESVTPGTVYTWRVVSVDASGNRSEAAEVTAEAR